MRNLTLGVSALALTLMGSAGLAQATTVETQTYVQSNAPKAENVKTVNFSVFDINNDGLYAKTEVGEKLFYMFDTDGNEVIDNLEWDNEIVYTITPMEKETYRFVDYNDDGYTDLTTYTYEQFYKESGLAHFDDNKNGLSAKEFIGAGFQSLDHSENNMIELNEWKKAYVTSYAPESANQERYN